MSVHEIKLFSFASTKKSVEAVFAFFSHIDKYYLQLSGGHKRFLLVNADALTEGVSIEDEETAGGQHLKHTYRVVTVKENRYIKLVSDPSIVRIFRFFRLPVKVTVEFEFKDVRQGRTEAFSCLTLEFRNKATGLLARVMGT